MVCSYSSSCLDLPVTLVDCWVEGLPLRLRHVYQGGYVVLNYIDSDRVEQNICRDYIDDLQGRGKSETLKKLVDSTVYGTDESEEDTEEVEGAVIGGGGDEVGFMPAIYPCGMVSVSSFCSFLSVGSSSKNYYPYLPLYLRVHLIQEYFKKKRRRNQKYTKPQEEKSRNEEQRRQMRVIVRAKLIVGYW